MALVTVTFVDKGCGQEKTYQVESGTQITLTKQNSTMTINNDTTINVTLPQLAAISLWDANKDGKIDDNDSKEIASKEKPSSPGTPNLHQNCVFAELLNSNLENSNSRYLVEQHEFGYFADAFGGYFHVSFINKNDEEDKKSITLQTPARQAYEAERGEDSGIIRAKKTFWQRIFK